MQNFHLLMSMERVAFVKIEWVDSHRVHLNTQLQYFVLSFKSQIQFLIYKFCPYYEIEALNKKR